MIHEKIITSDKLTEKEKYLHFRDSLQPSERLLADHFKYDYVIIRDALDYLKSGTYIFAENAVYCKKEKGVYNRVRYHISITGRPHIYLGMDNKLPILFFPKYCYVLSYEHNTINNQSTKTKKILIV